jgi:hypothetical protein
VYCSQYPTFSVSSLGSTSHTPCMFRTYVLLSMGHQASSESTSHGNSRPRTNDASPMISRSLCDRYLSWTKHGRPAHTQIQLITNATSSTNDHLAPTTHPTNVGKHDAPSESEYNSRTPPTQASTPSNSKYTKVCVFARSVLIALLLATMCHCSPACAHEARRELSGCGAEMQCDLMSNAR